MNIICWNVNGIRANVKKDGFKWLLQESPDIFCLQETKAHPDQLEEGVRSPAGYHAYFDHSKVRKGYSGVAIFSKEKPDRIEYAIGLPECDQEGRFLAAFYEKGSKMAASATASGKLLVITSYFPNGGGGPERLDFKLRFYDAFLEYINKYRKLGYEIIFCGDVNTAHTEIDLARPKENAENTGFLPVERAWIDQLVDCGYIDVFRHLNPKKTGAYTYWDMKTFARERNVGWRIDYFFVTPGVLNKVKSTRIRNDIYGSDHCPIELVVGGK